MRKLTEEEKERVVFTEITPISSNINIVNDSPNEFDEIWDVGDGFLLCVDESCKLLYKGYLKEEWKPKYKELVLMSDDNLHWSPRLFHSKAGRFFVDGEFDKDMNFLKLVSWIHCKPYKHDNKDN